MLTRVLRRPPLNRVHVEQTLDKVDECRAVVHLCRSFENPDGALKTLSRTGQDCNREGRYGPQPVVTPAAAS